MQACAGLWAKRPPEPQHSHCSCLAPKKLLPQSHQGVLGTPSSALSALKPSPKTGMQEQQAVVRPLQAWPLCHGAWVGLERDRGVSQLSKWAP